MITHMEINDNTNSQLKFKNTLLKSSLCNYSDAYILVKETITAVAAGATAHARQDDKNNKHAIFKNCSAFTDCVTDINNTKVKDTKNFDVVIPMYNLIECSDNYSGTSYSLWQYCKDE